MDIEVPLASDSKQCKTDASRAFEGKEDSVTKRFRNFSVPVKSC